MGLERYFAFIAKVGIVEAQHELDHCAYWLEIFMNLVRFSGAKRWPRLASAELLKEEM